MAWNYEKGCEEPDPYANATSGPRSCPPPVFYKRGAIEILNWERLESAWKRDRNWRTGTALPGLIAAWELAEMAVIGWDKRAQQETFRRGYIDWLATSSGAMCDTLSDLEIEQLPLIERIVAMGYRQLAKAAHPDTGGTAAEFEKLRNARVQLDRMLSEVGELLKEEG